MKLRIYADIHEGMVDYAITATITPDDTSLKSKRVVFDITLPDAMMKEIDKEIKRIGTDKQFIKALKG